MLFGPRRRGYARQRQPRPGARSVGRSIVRLPASIVDALKLKEGDEIEIHIAGEREFGVSRKPGREELLKRLRAFRGRLPGDFKFDRDEVYARHFF